MENWNNNFVVANNENIEFNFFVNREKKQILFLSYYVKKDFRIGNDGIIGQLPAEIDQTYYMNTFVIILIGKANNIPFLKYTTIRRDVSSGKLISSTRDFSVFLEN